MASKTRILGWTLFLAGLGLFLFMGSFEALQDSSAPGHIFSIVGIGAAFLGMILTSTSRLLFHLESMRRLKDRVRNQTGKSPGNSGPE